MPCTPAASAAVAHVALRVLPEPVSATDEHPASAVPDSVNATVPVGAAPVTLAVNVTLWPCVEGLAELASVVVVDVTAPPTVTLTVSRLVVASRTSMTMLFVASVNELPLSSAPSVNAEVAGVMSRNCVSSYRPEHPPQLFHSNGRASRT